MTKNKEKGATMVELCIVLLLSAIVTTMVVTLMVIAMKHTETNRVNSDSLVDFSIVETNLKRWIRHYDNYDYAILNAQVCDLDGKYEVKDNKGNTVVDDDGNPVRRKPSDRDAKGELFIGTRALTVQFGENTKVQPKFYLSEDKNQIIGELWTAVLKKDGTPEYDSNNQPKVVHNPDEDIALPVEHIEDLEFYVMQSAESGRVLITCVLSYRVGDSDEIKSCEFRYATHAQSVIARKTGQGKVVNVG